MAPRLRLALIVGPAPRIAGSCGEEPRSVAPEERGEAADPDALFGVQLTDSLPATVNVARPSRARLVRPSVSAPDGSDREDATRVDFKQERPSRRTERSSA
jgi:hypothetical protein